MERAAGVARLGLAVSGLQLLTARRNRRLKRGAIDAAVRLIARQPDLVRESQRSQQDRGVAVALATTVAKVGASGCPERLGRLVPALTNHLVQAGGNGLQDCGVTGGLVTARQRTEGKRQ